MRVYTAGPLGFFDAGRRHHDLVIVPRLRAAGHTVLDPWASGDAAFQDADPTDHDAMQAAARRIGEANEQMIRDCDVILAILDGNDVDSGTASEIGFAAAIGRRVVGVRTDVRAAFDAPGGTVNLQVEWFIARSGGAIVSDLDAAIEALAG